MRFYLILTFYVVHFIDLNLDEGPLTKLSVDYVTELVRSEIIYKGAKRIISGTLPKCQAGQN